MQWEMMELCDMITEIWMQNQFVYGMSRMLHGSWYVLFQQIA
jgi:hypothetical protein